MSLLEHITDFPRTENRLLRVDSIQFEVRHLNPEIAECSLVAFLFRYTGQEEISVSTGDSNGKTLVVSGDDSYSDLKQRLEDCEIEKGDFQIFLNCNGAALEQPERFEVIFELEGNALTLHYDAQLYTPETMERWAKYFDRVADKAANHPDSLISEVELSDPDERHLMLETWNAHSPESEDFFSEEPSADFCLHRVFEKQVERTPDRPAAESHGRIWTYRELDNYANQIAHFLLSQDVKPDERVGIYLDRSVEMLAALFGIMKSGGAYVPLDTALPRERLEYMAGDSGARLILTSPDLVGEAPVPESAEAVVLGSSEFERFTEDNPDSITTPDTDVDSSNLIYVIYTSGSTGMPKGVMLGHNSVVNYLWSIIEGNKLTADDVWFAYTTTAFDPSVKELFALLFIGGKVVVGPKGAGADGETLARLIKESDATKIFATPTSLRILIASGWSGDQNLDILSGGEAISRELANELVPLCRILYNVYGPTEATIFNTNKIMSVSDDPVTIGGPLAGCRLYVIDDAGKICPPNVRGNLFIGGVCLAHGYMNKPELTAEKFVADPFSEKSGAKMYDTGDVAYWTPEGEIAFLGRSDHQVKIRGYRIELGEIEKVLEDHPGVQDSVVIVREDKPGQPRIVAYVIPADGEMPDEDALRDFMSVPLPSYMIPGWFVEIDEFPLTPSRKTDRNALPKPEDAFENTAEDFDSKKGDQDLAGQIAAVWAKILGRRNIRVTDEVYAIGADSLSSVHFQAQINQQFGLRLPIAEIFQSRTPQALAERIREIRGESSSKIRTFSRDKEGERTSRDIAIIGMSGRFPGSGNLDEFWKNLIDEVESIRDLSEEEMQSWGVPRREYLRKGYVARSGDLKDAYDFDTEFFNISPSEAEILSPQIRLFLKTVWETMEEAGYPSEPENSRIGVYAGSGYPNYLFAHEEISDTERVRLVSANGMDYLATRASYLFGLTGPSLAIQTACSTSLVAINEACESLLAGRCEMAIAGASSFSWPHERGHLHEPGMIYSADGSNRSFDANATGTIFTQGVGAVMLKPLDAALADNDHVHAVIRGIAVNNDGNRKNGYASPSIEGQAEVISQAMANAGVTADEISYLEGHATGTKIGDPIEIAGLTRAWRESTERTQFCALGSVKSNIGHADAAAGIAGLFKLVLALKNQVIPATLHFSEPNPDLDIENSPFFIADKTVPWLRPNPDKPLLGAVSSFGIGGTNAHLILEEAPAVKASNEEDSPDLDVFPFSAATRAALDSQFEAWPDFLDANANLDSRDVAFTLRKGRRSCDVRSFAIAKTTGGLRETIANDGIVFPPSRQMVGERKSVFIFTGQGSQYVNMARDSYESDAVFRNAMDRCAEILDPLWDGSFLETFFAEDTEANRNQLLKTSVAQPAIFAVSYAQAMRWREWGIEPAALCGHSIGEYVAATIAGVMRLEDALPLVALRGQLMQSMAPGRMFAVMLPAEEVIAILDNYPDLDLAAANSPSFTVVSGDESSLKNFERDMELQDVLCKPLYTSRAFHSRSMEPMLEEFEKAVSNIELSAPKIPYPSNVSGTWITNEEATSPAYYASQVRSAVRFSDCLSTIVRDCEENQVQAAFLEMGPGKALTTFAREIISGTNHLAIPTLPTAKEKVASNRFTLETVGHLWSAGQSINWDLLSPPARRRRVSLPTYKFDEKTYRSPDQNIRGLRNTQDSSAESLLHVPVWKQTHLSPTLTSADELDTNAVWLCFSNGRRDRAFESELMPPNVPVVKIEAGRHFKKRGKGDSLSFTIRPGHQEDYVQLIESVIAHHGKIGGVVHAWTTAVSEVSDEAEFWDASERGSIGLLWLARAIGDRVLENRVLLNVVTTGLMGESVVPENHALSGVTSVIQREYPKIITKVIDLPEIRSDAILSATAQLITAHEHHPVIARRDGAWWKSVFEPLADTDGANQPLREIRDGGTYVFTGGLGTLALTIAKNMASQAERLNLILINRSPLPLRKLWNDSQAMKSLSDLDRWRIGEVQEIEALGATVKIHQADLSEKSELVAVMDQIFKNAENLPAGIFHTAGVNRDSVIAMKQDASVREVFAAKAVAALNLVNYLHGAPGKLDFLALFSSVSAELGYYGGSDYAAANAFLDGLAVKASRDGIPALAINWAIWREVGMGAKVADSDASATASGLEADLLEHSLSLTQGADAMLQVLAHSPSARTAVFPGNFEKRRQRAADERRAASFPKSNAKSGGVSGVAFPEGEEHRAPRDRMLTLWRECLKADDLDYDDNYFRKGGDSLAAIGLIAGIEEAFGQSIPMSFLISAPTVSSLIEKMGLHTSCEEPKEEILAENLPPHILSLSDDRNKIRSQSPRLFCVHGADGSVLFYKPFADRLKADFSVYAIESPMLGNSEAESNSLAGIKEIAKRYLNDVKSVQPSGPYYFGGYSYGAIVAWEIARLAIEQGDDVAGIIIYDMYNPAKVRKYAVPERLRVIWGNSGKQNGQKVSPLKQVAGFTNRLSQLAGWAVRHASTKLRAQSHVTSSDFKTHIEARQKHEAQLDSYKPDPLDIPAALIRTYESGDKFDFGELLGWKEIVREDVSISIVGGNHLEIFQEPNLSAVTAATDKFLAQTRLVRPANELNPFSDSTLSSQRLDPVES